MQRDKNGIAHVVGLSGGKDSTCLALALREREPRPYIYAWTPTGDELPSMLEHMQRLEQQLGPIVRLTNGSMATLIMDQLMLPNCHARFCTRLLKLKPFGAFMAAVAPAVAYIGLRADEDEREGARPGGDYATLNTQVKQDYPFQRWGWEIDDVWRFLDERGVVVPERTDCARCPYQRLGEWYNLWQEHPDIYADAEADEFIIGFTYRSDQRDSWPASLRDLRLWFEDGHVPERSLRMMEKRRGMCRACSL
jgi:3'-phosphoadenosine 5'-phosphosulfate sulfotransferase (PAPS reductase)/FAD synthetase